MWCTRWFLPLLLLPLPVASPYFLLLFLVSLTLHSRPCFYCIILLTALFTSSCYWQPVPTHSLFQSVVPGVSPDVPLRYIPNATLDDQKNLPLWQTLPVPKLTTLVDRCWCELSAGRFFEPYNGTSWQLLSLFHSLGIPDSRRVIVSQHQEPDINKIWVFKSLEADEEEEELLQDERTQSTSSWNFPSFITSLKLLFASSKSEPLSPPPVLPDPTAVANSTFVTEPDSQKDKGWSFILPPYDLRRFGINAILDF